MTELSFGGSVDYGRQYPKVLSETRPGRVADTVPVSVVPSAIIDYVGTIDVTTTNTTHSCSSPSLFSRLYVDHRYKKWPVGRKD